MGVLVAFMKMTEVIEVKKIQITKNRMWTNFNDIKNGMTHMPSIVTNLEKWLNFDLIWRDIIRVILYNTNVSYYNTKKNHFHTNVVITQNFFEH